MWPSPLTFTPELYGSPVTSRTQLPTDCVETNMPLLPLREPRSPEVDI